MRVRKLASVAAVVLAVALTFAGSAAAKPIGKRLTATFGTATPHAGDRTVATFTNSFTFNGVTYRYTMVGTDPHT
jgi:hypothetical protein